MYEKLTLPMKMGILLLMIVILWLLVFITINFLSLIVGE